MPRPPIAETRASATLRGLDEMLRTRPLLWTVFAGHGMATRDRWTVSTHTLGAVLRYWVGRATWALRETLGWWWTRSIRRCRPSLRGLSPVEGLEGSGWWRAVEPGAAHRCRIAFGRLRGPYGRASMTLFCGYSPESGDLPVYVLLDKDQRIAEMAFDDGRGRLSPGIGEFAPSRPSTYEALTALSAHLGGGVADEASILSFFGDRHPLAA